MPVCEVATYHSTNAKPEEAWLGYCILPKDGSQLLVRFSGATEAAVISKAQSWYDKEKRRQDTLYASTAAAADNDWMADAGTLATSRGSHLAAMFTGKVWMLNRATGERARVLPAEVVDYAAKGFERSGPRSK